MDSNSMLRGSGGFEWNHVVWFSQSHITGSKKKKIPRGRVQPIVAAVLEMKNKDGGAHLPNTRADNFCKL